MRLSRPALTPLEGRLLLVDDEVGVEDEVFELVRTFGLLVEGVHIHYKCVIDLLNPLQVQLKRFSFLLALPQVQVCRLEGRERAGGSL